MSREGGACNIDSVYRAAQAADTAVSLGFVSPIVIKVADYIQRIGFRRQSDCKWEGHSTARFEQLADLWRVYDKRVAEVERQEAARDEKVSKAPNAYICAAAGCGIEATHKAALLRCSGKCSVEGKPSYCSKDCQRKVASTRILLWFVIDRSLAIRTGNATNHSVRSAHRSTRLQQDRSHTILQTP